MRNESLCFFTRNNLLMKHISLESMLPLYEEKFSEKDLAK
eukprot:UN03700